MTDNWEEQRDAYKRMGRLADKKNDDLIGRRIIRGIGFANAEKAVYALEHGILGADYGTEPLFKRAVRLFKTLVGRDTGWCHLVKVQPASWGETAPWDPCALTIKSADEIVERFSIAPDYDFRPLIFTRIEGTNESRAFTIWRPRELEQLEPPFTALSVPEFDDEWNWRLVCQDTTHFVEQFGPYPVGAINDSGG